MATILYSPDGQEIRVNTDRVQAYLSAGYTPSPKDPEEETLREQAKELGIRGWHNSGPEKLREKIAEAQDPN